MGRGGIRRAIAVIGALTIGTTTVWAAAPSQAGLFPNNPPTAVATASPNPAHAGQTVHLFGTGSSDPETSPSQLLYAWDFGDGDTVAASTGNFAVDHVYAAGVYTATLTVTDPDGKSDSDKVVVEVDDTEPTARATATPTAALVDHDVKLDGSTSSDAETPSANLTYLWTFGDGGTSTAIAPTHAFATAGKYVVGLTVKDPQGASSATTVTVTVTNTAPTSAFTLTPSAPHVGQQATLDGTASTDAETPADLSYDWDFGDATEHATTKVATHTFASSGYKSVKLTVTDPQGLSDTKSLLVNVGSNRAPVAVATATRAKANVGQAVGFDGTGSSDAETPNAQLVFSWNFDDGGSADDSTGASTTHAFTSPGTYVVVLSVTDPQNHTDTDTVTVIVGNEAPVAGAVLTPSPAHALQSVAFDGSTSTDAETPDQLSYSWIYGDGTAATPYIANAHSTHAYAAAGTYGVTLRVKDAEGSIATKTVSLSVLANGAPTAAASATPNPVHIGKTVTFSSSGSSDPDGDALTYAWSFPGGASASTATAQRSFAAVGAYEVTLTVTDPYGVSASKTVTVQVTNAAPTAAASATPNPVHVGKAVTFSSTGSSDPDGDALTYAWSFPGGATASTPSAQHTFAAVGSYEVTLTVTDPYGGSATKTVTVQVTNTAPTAAASATPNPAHLDGTVTFDGTGSSDPDGDALTYAWSFPGGATASTATAQHSFAVAGSYEVTLTVTDPYGATASKTVTVQVTNNAPVVTATATPNPVHIGNAVTFSGAGSSDPDGDALTYAWSFPGGATASTATAQHTFAALGSYEVTLTVTDSHGASTSKTVTVQVTNNAPVVKASASPNPVHVGKAVTFSSSGTADADGDTLTYEWSYAGTTSTGPSKVLTFDTEGPKSATLTVTDEHGASATKTVTVNVVNDAPGAGFSNTSGLLLAGGNVDFRGGGIDTENPGQLTFAWTFGDGGTASGPSARHVYRAPGAYRVTLTVKDPQGKTGTSVHTVLIAKQVACQSGSVHRSSQWRSVRSTLAHGGTYCDNLRGTRRGGTVTVTTAGPRFGLVYGTSRTGGKAQIIVDGVVKATVSFRSTDALSFGHRKFVSGLSAGKHRVTIKMTSGPGYLDDLLVYGPVF